MAFKRKNQDENSSGSDVTPSRPPLPDPGVVEWRTALRMQIDTGFVKCLDGLSSIILDYLIPVAVQLLPMDFGRDQSRMVHNIGGNLQPVVYRVAEIQTLPTFYNLTRNELILVAQPFTSNFQRLQSLSLYQSLTGTDPTPKEETTRDTEGARIKPLLRWGVDRCQLSDELLVQLDSCVNEKSETVEIQLQQDQLLKMVKTFDSLGWYQTRLIVVARHGADCRDGCCVAASEREGEGYPPPLVSVPLPIPSPLSKQWLCHYRWSISQACHA